VRTGAGVYPVMRDGFGIPVDLVVNPTAKAVTSNAGTIAVAAQSATFTSSSAATMAVTLAVAGATGAKRRPSASMTSPPRCRQSAGRGPRTAPSLQRVNGATSDGEVHLQRLHIVVALRGSPGPRPADDQPERLDPDHHGRQPRDHRQLLARGFYHRVVPHAPEPHGADACDHDGSSTGTEFTPYLALATSGMGRYNLFVPAGYKVIVTYNTTAPTCFTVALPG